MPEEWNIILNWVSKKCPYREYGSVETVKYFNYCKKQFKETETQYVLTLCSFENCPMKNIVEKKEVDH